MKIFKKYQITTTVLPVLFLFVIWAPPAAAEDRLSVVTTIPDLADMARAVGGERVDVKSVARGGEDMHMIPVKPSYLLMLNKADLLIEMGLDNEHAWLPALLNNCRNDRIQPGAPGFINCSARIAVREAQDHPTRAEGDMHPEGNPHFNLDPANGRLMVMTICEGLCRVCPEHAEAFRQNLNVYLGRLDAKIAEWQERAKALAGVKVITYHRSWSYFVGAFNMQVVGEIEPKPGIAPTAGHLARLIRMIREEGADLIIQEPYYSDRYAALLREKTGLPVVVLANMSGGTPETATYISFIEHNLNTVIEALDKADAVKKGEPDIDR